MIRNKWNKKKVGKKEERKEKEINHIKLTVEPRDDVNDVPWLGQGVEKYPNCWTFRFIGSSQEPVRSGASGDRLAMKSKTVTSVDVVSLSDICIRNLGGRHLWISINNQAI